MGLNPYRYACSHQSYLPSIPAGMCMVHPPAQPFLTNWSMYDPSAKCWKWLFEPAVPTSRSSESSPTPVSPTTHHTAPTSEQLIAQFFNSITLTIKEKVPSIGQNGIKHHWMAEWSCNPMPGSSGYIWKPDLNLVNNSTLMVDEISWWSPKVLTEYTKESFQPTKCLRKMMDSKAYITFLEQPWRQS